MSPTRRFIRDRCSRIWSVAALAFGASTAAAQDAERAMLLRVSRVATGVKLDGALSEPAWQTTDSIASLTQVEPEEGATPSARTVTRVLTTPDAIVFGIRVDYAPGMQIVSYSRGRDADLDSEDHIAIVLDTYRDGRSGYFFAVNAHGARFDALIGQGDTESSWDGIWEAATTRTETGWSTEIRIPIKTLLFLPGLSTWGFNVERRIQSLLETDRWASASRNLSVTQTSRAGILGDVPPFALGKGLSIRPSLAVGGAHDSAGAALRNKRHASLDLTQRLGGNFLASLTVNTDFAETEVDSRRVNLTRFPLFFPEKRTFFLEGADVFAFSSGESALPFFSRRLGLYNGVEVPINAGLKVNGRAGGTSFGALAARTGNVDSLSTGTSMGAVRVQRNVLGESSVGFIATAGDPVGRRGAWLAGPDLTYRTSSFRGDKNLVVGAWALGVGRERLDGDRSAAGVSVEYPNDRWEMSADYKRIGDAFDPSLGFVPRPGVHQASAALNWQPRPERPIGPVRVRQCFWENEASYVAGLTGGWQSYELFMAPINCRLESGDRFEFNVVPVGERLTEPFEISDGVELPPGAYHFRRFRLEAEFASKRRLSGEATWWFGRFYTGYLNQYELSAEWKPSPLFIVEFSGERNVGHMPEGHFVEDVYGTRLKLSVSPDLQVVSFLQYENGSNTLSTNTRLRWTFSPVGDLFVVYNHALRTRDPVTLRRGFGFGTNQLLAKVQYAFRY